MKTANLAVLVGLLGLACGPADRGVEDEMGTASAGLDAACKLSWSNFYVPPGGSVQFKLLTLGTYPANSISYLYGTKNGVQDEFGSAFSGPNFNYTITNAPGLAGSYNRWVIVRGPSDEFVCQSFSAPVVFQ